jgi:hypothetical protein
MSGGLTEFIVMDWEHHHNKREKQRQRESYYKKYGVPMEKPKRSDYPAYREGALQYAAAMKEWEKYERKMERENMIYDKLNKEADALFVKTDRPVTREQVRALVHASYIENRNPAKAITAEVLGKIDPTAEILGEIDPPPKDDYGYTVVKAAPVRNTQVSESKVLYGG